MAKIAILVPSMTMVHADFAVSLASVMAYTAGHTKHEVILMNERGALVTVARNSLVRKALAHDVDAMLFLDSDMTFPADTLARLWKRGPIYGATYNKRAAPYTTLGVFPKAPVPGQTGFLPATMIPAGCMMVRSIVFKELPAPWFRETYEDEYRSPDNPDGVVGEDVNFCRDATAAGFEIECDLDLTFDPAMAHIGEQRICVGRPQ